MTFWLFLFYASPGVIAIRLIDCAPFYLIICHLYRIQGKCISSYSLSSSWPCSCWFHHFDDRLGCLTYMISATVFLFLRQYYCHQVIFFVCYALLGRPLSLSLSSLPFHSFVVTPLPTSKYGLHGVELVLIYRYCWVRRVERCNGFDKRILVFWIVFFSLIFLFRNEKEVLIIRDDFTDIESK